MEPTVEPRAPVTRGALGPFLRYGFRLAFLYCCLGISLELLRPLLTEGLYHRLAGFVYGVPLALLALVGLAEPLAAASVEGHLPLFVAAAAAPAVGVLSILGLALLSGTGALLVRVVLSLKHRA